MTEVKLTEDGTRTLEVIGYTSPINNPDVITSAVLRDTGSGAKFFASIYEVFKMMDKGMVTLPKQDAV